MELALILVGVVVLALLVRLSSAPRAEEQDPSDIQTISSADLAAVAKEGRRSPQNPVEKEAAALARLLVSEILLYNSEAVEKGRRYGDLYLRLQEDIERSRRLYLKNVDPGVEFDFFLQSLVDRLAKGDASLLGLES